ncbi:MAG TPA: type I 3-dehydroquinate dehydratase [Nonomuraea sp.]|nr:type I 3-dehydroquinate dehydratase [Nonomuraea sp.]
MGMSPLSATWASAPGAGPVSVVATLAGWPIAGGGAEPVASGRAARCLEVRADLAGDVDPVALRGVFSGGLLYTLRSAAEGGRCADPPDRRRARLLAAADRYDVVELEARDLHPDVLDAIAPERRVIAWHGRARGLADLRRRFEAMAGVPARLYRLGAAADSPGQALVPLLLLRSLGRTDVTAYACGQAGAWTRIVAARFGAPVLFGTLDGEPVDGAPPLRRLLTDYPRQVLSGAERLYGIFGASTTRSLAPLVYNTAYRSLGLPALYVPFDTDDLGRAVGELAPGLDRLGLPLAGATVVAPHKDAALALAAEASPLARRAAAASLLVRTRAGWRADTEAAGVVATLGQAVEPAGRRVAVVGCGGGGRAAAAGLTQAGAEVTLVNRGAARGLRAARLLGLPYVRLPDFDPRSYDVVVHATPVADAVPFPVERLAPGAVVFDLNYRAADTPLVAAARAAGHVTLDGRRLLLVELARQFHLMTGQRMPVADVRAALGLPEGEAADRTTSHAEAGRS